MKKISLILILLSTFPIFSISIGLTKPEVSSNKTESTDYLELLFDELRELDPYGTIDFRKYPEIGNTLTVFDASTVAKNYNLNQVLYGFIEETDLAVELEFFLYDYYSRSIVKNFMSKATYEDKTKAIEFLARQIQSFLFAELKLPDPSVERGADLRHFAPYVGAGLWVFLNGMEEKLHGTGQGYFGFYFQPFHPYKKNFNGINYFRLGFQLNYGYAMTTEAVTEAYLHELQTGFYVDHVIRAGHRHNWFIGVGASGLFDWFYQVPSYDNPNVTISQTISNQFRLGYEFLGNKEKERGLGILLNLTGIWYTEELYRAGASIYLKY